MTPTDLYLDLLKRTLTRTITEDGRQAYAPVKGTVPEVLYKLLIKETQLPDLGLVRNTPFALEARVEGTDWPAAAETMIGLRRLDNLEYCVRTALDEGVPGDLIETGVWRGGAAIFMRAILKAYGDTQRNVWLADSFRGLPRPDAETYPSDKGDILWMVPQLAISRQTVEDNFRRYNLLDDQVKFLEGWFRDTLPGAPIERLAVLRLDGDLYESTIVALDSLYWKVSAGGFVIIDDYGAMFNCRQAVEDFRARHEITAPLQVIDSTGVYSRVGSA